MHEMGRFFDEFLTKIVFLSVKIIVWLSDPACGPTVTPDCKFLEKSGICLSEPMRCIYGCTLCKKPKDLLPLILPQSRDKNSLRNSPFTDRG